MSERSTVEPVKLIGGEGKLHSALFGPFPTTPFAVAFEGVHPYELVHDHVSCPLDTV